MAVAGALGAALVALPASASSLPSSGSFIASDFAWTAAGGGTRLTIAQGGTVSFSYPSGRSEHNAHFSTGNPSSCVQTAGDNLGAVPPLPHHPDGAGWSGSCTFNQPGIYRFHCEVHPFMIGTVAVQASGTSPTDSPLAGAAAAAIRLPRSQRGTRVRGSVRVSRAGQGGSLQVAVLARASDLGRGGSRLVTVGAISEKLRTGTVELSVSLNRSARNALRKRGRLGVEVKLVARSPAGRTVRATRTVTLRH